LLAARANCNAGGIENERPVHIAFKEYDYQILLMLLNRHELRLGEEDAHHNIALHFAALRIGMDSAIVHGVIVNTPADKINAQNENGDTALSIAIRERNEEFALVLLAPRDDRAEINLSLCDTAGNSPLHVAAANPLLSPRLIDALVTKASADAINKQQTRAPHYTVLIIAIRYNNIEFVRQLLDRRDIINPNFPDGKGKTPLIIAIEIGRVECIRTLLGHAAIRRNTADRKGNTPAHYAVVAGLPLVLRKALLTHPYVYYSIVDAAHIRRAARSAFLALDVQQEIVMGANLSLTNNNGNTPVHIAAQIASIKPELVRSLVATANGGRVAIHTFNKGKKLACDISGNASSDVQSLITPYWPTRCYFRSKSYFSKPVDLQAPFRVEFEAAAAQQDAEQLAQACTEADKKLVLRIVSRTVSAKYGIFGYLPGLFAEWAVKSIMQ
jgi:ankyrin repeat protein